MKRKLLLLIMVCVVSVSMLGCKGRDAAADAQAQLVADAFEANDVEAINEIIFGTSDLVVDEELSDVWGEQTQPQSQDGVMASIFKLTSVKVKGASDGTIEYEVEAPDMSGVFASLDADAFDMSEEELLDYIRDYAQNARPRKATVSLEYLTVDGDVVVNYRDEAFINAVTGGLVDAYKGLYSEMLEEYAQEVTQQ